MVINAFDEQYFSPILQPPTTNTSRNYYKNQNAVWQFFLRPKTKELTMQAVKSVTSKFNLNERSDEIKLDILIDKINVIEKKKGLRYPKTAISKTSDGPAGLST